MKKLETRGMPLTDCESMDLITNTMENMKKILDEYGKVIIFIFDSVLDSKNPGFNILKINKILKGNNVDRPLEILACY